MHRLKIACSNLLRTGYQASLVWNGEADLLKTVEASQSDCYGNSRTNNATIEVIIEDSNFNNSLAGSLNCPNAYPKSTGNDARDTWRDRYLKDGMFCIRMCMCHLHSNLREMCLAQSRFQSMTEGFEWTIEDVYAAQNMCPYETVAYGYSRFCELFTYQEWEDYSYSIDLYFSGISGFNSPTSVSDRLRPFSPLRFVLFSKKKKKKKKS